jgi:hypothetical protein
MSTIWRPVARAGCVAAMMTLIACSGGGETPESTEAPAGLDVPLEVAGWRATGGHEVYDTESIYGYINGHAEVYLAYGMQRCLSWRYEGPGGEPSIVLDLFQLGSSADAYGVFTHDRDGEAVDVGQGALRRPGWLSFWKGSWYGSVYVEGESEAADETMMALAEAAAGTIAEEGPLPPLVAELPAAGLDPGTVRFFHTQEILNSVVYLGFDNVLHFGPEIDAVVGRYELDSGEGWLLLVDYPDEAAAALAEERGAEAGLLVKRRADRLAAVLAPQPVAMADELLEIISGGM